MKVGVLGTPVSSGNRGVMALGASLVSLCTAAGADDIVMFVGHHAPGRVAFQVDGEGRSVRIVNYRLSPRARPHEHLAWIIMASGLYRLVPWKRFRRWLSRSTPWIAALEEMDVVGDIRGGDSFSDIYGTRRFLLGFLAAWSVILVRGSLMQFPQTYGPYRRKWVRWLAGALLRRAPVILARDRESLRLARELVGGRQTVQLSPDVAFALESRSPGRLLTEPGLTLPVEGISKVEARPIGVNANGLMYHGGYTRRNMFGLRLDYAAFLPELITALLSEHPGELWLVPHTYAPPESVESDPGACRRVRAALPANLQGRVRQIVGDYDCHEIKGIIGQCDFFVGSRMHACIAALSQGVPCAGVAYSMKFKGVFETVGMEDWVVDGREVSTESAVARVLELYRQRDRVREDLKRRSQEARQQLTEVFRQLFAPVNLSRPQPAPRAGQCSLPFPAVRSQ